jgi:hypothetical protein
MSIRRKDSIFLFFPKLQKALVVSSLFRLSYIRNFGLDRVYVAFVEGVDREQQRHEQQ